jgi:regulator of sigma E protease
MSAILVVGILVFLIVIHELGHFAVAKFFKVKVEEFGVGYPPRAFLLGKINETEYTLNWIPFGGFVRLVGEHDTVTGEISKEKGSFAKAPRYVQALILVAGVVMNAFAAWILFAGALSVGIPHGLPVGESDPNARLLVTQIVSGSPADVVGLKPGDVITSIRDKDTAAALAPDTVVAFVSERAGKEIALTYSRAGQETTATLYPAQAVLSDTAERAALGVGLSLVTDSPMPFFEALRKAIPVTIDKLQAVLGGLKSMAVQAIRGEKILEDIVGPVGLVGVVGVAAQHGFGNLLVLAGFISLNLAVINLIPIPALDGGRLVLLGIEALMRRSAPRVLVQLTNTLGIGLIALLMITVTYNDIARLFS